MKKLFVTIFALTFLMALPAYAVTPSLSVSPEKVIQGDPVFVTINNVSGLSQIKNITFAGLPVKTILYNKKPGALIPIDLAKKIGDYKIVVTLADGKILQKTVTVTLRPKFDEVVSIPKSLGGNTAVAQKALVDNLAKEKETVNSLWTNPKQLWTEKFRLPVATPIITSTYGYSRTTGAYSIPHKGTDFRAKIGTPVYAMNRGVVRLVATLPSYGNIVVIDHGMGLMTMYLHLSKFKVYQGQLVTPGQLIALSGDTGYAEGAHLHLSIRIGGISIDPETFMSFFK